MGRDKAKVFAFLSARQATVGQDLQHVTIGAICREAIAVRIEFTPSVIDKISSDADAEKIFGIRLQLRDNADRAIFRVADCRMIGSADKFNNGAEWQKSVFRRRMEDSDLRLKLTDPCVDS